MTDVHINITNKPVSAASNNDAFEKMYVSIREKEKRVYQDAEVVMLPNISASHTHYKEWLVRKRSVNRLFNYLEKKNKPLSILEVGCGNGWLIAQLSTLPGSNAIGIDINKIEIEQAKRVFSKKHNLEFLQTDLDKNNLKDKKFDAIIFAASISYFDSLEAIISRALSFLNKDGEVHVLDSFFYKKSEIDTAKKRAYDYCESLGHVEMTEHYFHHCIDTLKNFNHKILFNPLGFKNKLSGTRDPFPWIVIKNK
ncbi:MAG: class I SAM-dependent methyltransferase [Ferruginibacter sp.]